MGNISTCAHPRPFNATFNSLDSYKHFNGTNKDAHYHTLHTFTHLKAQQAGSLYLNPPAAQLISDQTFKILTVKLSSLHSCHLYGIGGVPARCFHHLTSHSAAWHQCTPGCCQRRHDQGSQAPRAPIWPSLPLRSLPGQSSLRTGWQPVQESTY